jgi:hypothetical protein
MFSHLINPKIDYKISKTPSYVCITIQNITTLQPPLYFLKIHFNIILSATPRFPKSYLPFSVFTKTFSAFVVSHMCIYTTCTIQLPALISFFQLYSVNNTNFKFIFTYFVLHPPVIPPHIDPSVMPVRCCQILKLYDFK